MRISTWYWFRVGIMILAFIGSVIAIRNLDQIQSSRSAKKINLCPTRVKEISVVGGMHLVQEGMAWFRKNDGRMEELDPIAVEKWFGRHCVVDADPAEAPIGSGNTLATFVFVSGEPQNLLTTEAGIFTWKNEPFSSLELKEALQTLPELPIRLRPSR